MKAIIAILSAALVALGGAAVHLWRQLDASRQQAADLQAQLDTTAASARQNAAIAPSPFLPLADSAVAAQATLANATEENPAVARATIATPEMMAGVKAIQRGQMPNLYPDVGKVLGLSPGEVARLYDLLTENANSDELASLLGSKYGAWQQYTTEVPTRLQVKSLDAVLNAAGTPLSDAQRKALIPAVTAAERSNSQEREAKGLPSLSGLSRYSPEANQKILDAAAAHLTPQQLESYRQMLERASGRETALREGL